MSTGAVFLIMGAGFLIGCGFIVGVSLALGKREFDRDIAEAIAAASPETVQRATGLSAQMRCGKTLTTLAPTEMQTAILIHIQSCSYCRKAN